MLAERNERVGKQCETVEDIYDGPVDVYMIDTICLNNFPQYQRISSTIPRDISVLYNDDGRETDLKLYAIVVHLFPFFCKDLSLPLYHTYMMDTSRELNYYCFESTLVRIVCS